MSKGNKIKLGIIVCLAIITFICFGVILQLSHMPHWEKTSFTIEYGKPVDIQNKILDQDAGENLRLDLSAMPNEDGKDYPAVGTYTVNATLNSTFGAQTKDIKIKIKDTKGPVFTTAPDTVEISFGNTSYDFTQDFAAEDISGDVDLSVDTSKVNFSEAGTYPATITAKDKYNNVTKKSFHVIVDEQPVTTTRRATTTQTPVYSQSTAQDATNGTTTYQNNNGSTYTNPNGNTYSQYPYNNSTNTYSSNASTYDTYNSYQGNTSNSTYPYTQYGTQNSSTYSYNQ